MIYYIIITHQQQEIVFPQHENDILPPAGKERKRSITKNPKIGGLPLIPIQHERSATQARKNIEVGSDFLCFIFIITLLFLCVNVIKYINYFFGFKSTTVIFRKNSIKDISCKKKL